MNNNVRKNSLSIPLTNTLPQQQRIITSKQWVFNNEKTGPASTASSSTTVTSTVVTNTMPLDIKPKRQPKKKKEAESEQLQLEYDVVKQENAKLKNVIGKLRQEIDVYTKLLLRSSAGGRMYTNANANANMNLSLASATPSGLSTPTDLNELPSMESLLVNTSKRRKKVTPTDATATAAKKRGRKKKTASKSPENLPGTVPEQLVSSNQVPMMKNDNNNDVMLLPSNEEVGPEDIMLMHRLTDVLANME